MENKKSKKKNVPANAEEYEIKFVFNNESNININEIIKKSFLLSLNKNNHLNIS